MTARAQVTFVLLLLQVCFALTAGAGAAVAAVVGLPAAPAAVLGLATAGALLLAAAGQVRGWRRGLRALLVFEFLCAGAGALDLILRPDLLATVTNVALPLAIAISLLTVFPSRRLSN